MRKNYFVADTKEDQWGKYPSMIFSYHETLSEAAKAAKAREPESLYPVEVFYISGTESSLCAWREWAD